MVAEQHYADANTLFNELQHWDEVIRLQLEKAGIYEFQLKRLTGVVSKMRNCVYFNPSWIAIVPQKKLCPH
ncbi:hypothetical protein DAPPUDRAFT_333462 [Daphnia pulex]|uniref:Uncharacterized protein n=1 Tax=Daphnia pulex TaxID=6669 RepID=E9HSW5_DAPPU|nr:hypothetical protein DAPPUDRAFT_333462 [Daphnia pulex]|eukprot:EFX65168.1 hypothetical protein DAPPUDRAFT_333462 [Daphnia pulex]